MEKPTAEGVIEMLQIAAMAQQLVTEDNVTTIMRKLADDTDRGPPELRQAVAHGFGIFLSAMFELSAKAAMEQMAADGPEARDASGAEGADDGLD